jgi:hypothetical protein
LWRISEDPASAGKRGGKIMDRGDFYWLASSVWLILAHENHEAWTYIFSMILLCMAFYHTWFKKKPIASYKLTLNFGDNKKLRNEMADEFKLALDNENVEVKTVVK